ncbi:MAG: glycoside hydrolase [Betaproteobacteria bacterium]|nr:glycoside hydrolase [Betaproteobacteria bacterium]
MKKITTAVAILLGFLTGVPSSAADVAHGIPEAQPQAQYQATHPYMERAGEIIFYALSLVGVHYRWGGSSPQTGFDCSGLVNHVFRQIAGMVLPRDSYGMARLGTPIALDELRPGDLVFFNTRRRPFSHVGIYLGERRFLHAPSAGKTVNIVDMTQAYWAKRYNGARRIGL